MEKVDYSEFLKYADIAAKKKHHSSAKHQVINHVYDPEKDKYVKVKRFKAKTTMSRKEERKFFGHGFSYKGKKKFSTAGDYTLFFDKNDQLSDILPLDEASARFLAEHRGQPMGLFDGAEQIKLYRLCFVEEIRLQRRN